MAIKQWGFLRILMLLIILVFRDPEEPIQNSKCSLIMVIYACLYKNMSFLKSPLLNRFSIYVQILPITKITLYFLCFILKLSNASYTSLWLNCMAYLASGFKITNFVFWSKYKRKFSRKIGVVYSTYVVTKFSYWTWASHKYSNIRNCELSHLDIEDEFHFTENV